MSYYQQWQKERFGNVLPESIEVETEDDRQAEILLPENVFSEYMEEPCEEE